jgi:hypothetical protein
VQNKEEMENNGYVDVTGIEDAANDVNGQIGTPTKGVPKMNKEITIDRIKDDRINPDTGRHEYLIKWKPVKESWEDAHSIDKFANLVQTYQVCFFRTEY